MEIRAHWMRGGTSKCWVFEAENLKKTGLPVDQVLLRLFGSPDNRQLDGVGGGTSTTSKAVIVSRSSLPEVDISFNFAQIGIEEAKVDWGSNCGNCSATVGLFAIEQGWVPAAHPQTRVRVFNENTGQHIIQTLDTPEGKLSNSPTEMMLGANFGGHKVLLGFTNPEGGTTGRLFPAGEKITPLHADGGKYSATMVDAGAPTVLLPAHEFNLDPQSYEQWAEAIMDRLPLIDDIRRQAAVAMGIAKTPESAERAIPKIGIYSASPDINSDILILMFSMGKPHPALPITASVAITKAAKTPGALMHIHTADPHRLQIRTPVGVIDTNLIEEPAGTEIGVVRTSRTIAEADLFIPENDIHLEIIGAR